MLEELREARTILVTFLMHLGDLLLVTPFLTALRRAAPEARITVLVDEKLAGVLRHNPDVDAVLGVDKDGWDGRLVELWRIAALLDEQGYDLLINLHPDERTSFIGTFCGAKCKAGAMHPIFQPYVTRAATLNRALHAADMYLDVLAQLGVRDLSHDGLKMPTGAADEAAAEAFWRRHGVGTDDRPVGFHVGSAVVTKRWAPDRFAAVADALAAEGHRAVFFGGPRDEVFVRETVAALRRARPIVAAGAFTIGQLAAALRRCRLVVTNDSGPMHVAVSQRVPVVAVFGPSVPELYGPYTPDATVVRAEPPCTGCAAEPKKECGDMQCLTRLSVDQVLRAVAERLDRRAPPL